jgi:AcrR family transcriptional regulator
MTDQSVIVVAMKNQAKRALKPARARNSGAAKAQASGASSGRRERVAAGPDRRTQILAAALDEFSQNGFAAARLDDVAKRAGVAKGTIYLYFKDKETLFHELLRAQISPVVAMLEAMLAGGDKSAQPTIPLRQLAHRVADLFIAQVLSTRRKDVIRLILTEGPRFPKLAEFYYREVVSRGVAAVRGRMQRAVKAGELEGDALARFPQLIVAPALVAIMWKSMFEKFEPLDAKALMHAHIDILFGSEGQS